MNRTVKQVLSGNADNHILPFFWQHGEDEATLRKLMGAIQEAGCGAVCVESRPHPDFCGEKWWTDMDIILDEARKRNMKVWILDDSHFPTGFANNALQDKPDSLCRQNIFVKEKLYRGKALHKPLNLKRQGFFRQASAKAGGIHSLFLNLRPPVRKFSDDSILCVTARQGSRVLDLTDKLQGDVLHWEKPEGDWTLSVVVRSRNTGSRRNYINMTETDSCQVLIDAVYEPHWQHYAADFGVTIAGFFSDEPELGNGPAYPKYNFLGTEQDLPWGQAMEKEVTAALGADWRKQLYLLWREGDGAAQVRSRYMDVLTRLVRSAFSQPVADWCRDHGVQYIGHIIEDDGQHCRTGSSLGHYFRGLQYQHMSGIDDIGGQVYPQGEDMPLGIPYHQPRNGEFYHYGLATLARSAAAIEHRKQGNAMCEIFGNYMWSEGLKLEKYLADHFLVRGINQFVPHAFSGRAFPDPDCPPHFYAHGHHPQFRHFGELMRYMNRVATLTSSGTHEVPVAILYHGESEWADKDAMPFETPLRVLYDRQIDCHTVPSDIFTEPEHYRTTIGNPLTVNKQQYRAFVVPACRYLSAAAANGIAQLAEAGLPVFFVGRRPECIAETGEPVPAILGTAPCVPLEQLYGDIRKLLPDAPVLTPDSNRVRLLHIHGDTELFFAVNEADTVYEGELTLPVPGDCFLYDPWHNSCHPATVHDGRIHLTLEPAKSVFCVFGDCDSLKAVPAYEGYATQLLTWQRSLCPGIRYPEFEERKAVSLPDNVALEKPEFSGFVRYETNFPGKAGGQVLLEISDAEEGVEVFLNGRSLGIQIVPPFRYDLSGAVTDGENHLAIEVATTLERQAFPLLTEHSKKVATKPEAPTGLTGTVRLITK